MTDQIPNLTPLFNRSAESGSDGPVFNLPGDGWYHLVPKGVFPVRDTEANVVVHQVIDDQAVVKMVNRFSEDAKAKNFPGLLIDYDHFSEDEDKPSSAAGWVHALQNRADGVWGQIKWTPRGEQALKDGEYRFVSPVWFKKQAEPIAGLKNHFRPIRLDSLGLTNQPNLRGMVPLSNRDRAGSDELSGENKTKSMKRVNETLGLSPDAAEEVAVSETIKLKNRVTELETSNATLVKTNEELSKAQVELALDKYKNRFKAEKRDAWKNRLTEDYAGAVEILEEMTPIATSAAASGHQGGGKLLNRKDASTPEGERNDVPKDAKGRAAKIETLTNDYKLKNRCSTQEAYDAIERSNPELFQATEESEA